MKRISIIIMNDELVDQVINLDKVKSIDVTDYKTSTDLNITLLNGVELNISIKEKNYQLIIEKVGEEDEA